MDDQKTNPQPQKTSDNPTPKQPTTQKPADPHPSGDSLKHQGDKLREAVE